MITRSTWTLIVVASSLVVVAAVTAALWSSPDPKPSATAISPSQSTSTPSASTATTPDAGTPSSTEPAAASSTTPAPKGPSQAPAPKLKPVDVVTTFAGWNATSRAVEIGGYAAVVERAGTCTLRLTHGDQVVTRMQTASADATTVACGAFAVPGTALTAGAWQAVLAYTSSTSTGKATAVTVEVP